MNQKKKVLKITIPEPCDQKIKNMTPVKGGHFCGSCEKTVVDFRFLSDRQITQFYEKNNRKICGVFNPEQLNRAIPFPVEMTPTKHWKAIAALTAGLLIGGSSLVAQAPTPAKGTPIIQAITLGEVIEQENDNTSPERIVKGTVLDKEDGESLIGATILISGTTVSTITDFDGNFELKIPNELDAFNLVISYTGFIGETITFRKNDSRLNESITIELNQHFLLAGEVVIAGGIRSLEYYEEETTSPEPIEFEQKETELVEKQLSVYPNPFEEKLTVTYDFDLTDDYLFNLYDVKGSLVFAKTIYLNKGAQMITLIPPSQQLVNGMYILQLSDSQDRILASKKVFKGQP